MTFNQFREWLNSGDRRPLVMGVLNVTPDSFSDGGKFAGMDAAIARAEELVAEGASILDIGGESTRPGAQPVDAQEQIRRVAPVIRAAAKSGVLLSIDTTRAEVAEAAVQAGCRLVNDISGGRDDAGMLQLVAKLDVPIVLMHMQGTPATMQENPAYGDVVKEVRAFLSERIDAAEKAGISRESILIDPGIGFGKKMEHNLTLIRRIGELKALGRPMVVGVSRKGFIGTITGEPVAANRSFGTAAAVSWCIANGADILRVHDVKAMVQVMKMTLAIMQERAEE